MTTERPPRPRVVIAGSGVAAVETLLALRELIGPNVAIELLAPERELVHRPSSVAVPFGFGAPEPLDVDELAARMGADVRRAAIAGVDRDRGVVQLAGGGELPYDRLVVAIGAHPHRVLPGAVRFAGPADAPAVQEILEAMARGDARSAAFALPGGAAWTLPVYELAVMAAVDLRSRGVRDAQLSVVTPEREPLWLFGPTASPAVRDLLESRGVTLHTSSVARTVHEGELELDSGKRVPADAVIALPELEGPSLPGLPEDEGGFLPIDAYGRVTGAPGVYAAGDATAFPVKQGGLATQQADAVAEAIALDLGLRHEAHPFHPVLRGLLLTGGAPLYLRAELSPAGEVTAVAESAPAPDAIAGVASARALWWPPGKVAGRYLAPYLATARPGDLGRQPLVDRTATAAEPAPGREDALELALMMADEDARAGDLRQALHALDAALALGGGTLPAGYASRRAEWRRELAGH
jgi:sulfide:quinone oxidoreductase